MEAAIFDIDGTLFHMDDRIWQGGVKFDWDAFLDKMDGEAVIHNTWVHLSNHYLNDRVIIAVTARPEKYRDQTEALLQKLGIPFSHIIMRPDVMLETETAEVDAAGWDKCDSVKSIIHKHHASYRLFTALEIKDKLDDLTIVAAYDDQLKNLEVWKDHFEGIECWHVNKGKLTLLVEEAEAA